MNDAVDILKTKKDVNFEKNYSMNRHQHSTVNST